MKPDFRQYDEHPKRHEDIKVKAFGVEVEASGRTVVMLILLVMLVLLGFLHHTVTVAALTSMGELQKEMTCVLTLNEDERREYRTEGKYCGYGPAAQRFNQMSRR